LRIELSINSSYTESVLFYLALNIIIKKKGYLKIPGNLFG